MEPTADGAHSHALLVEALNGLVKRVRQLERDNARLRKRQRKHREEPRSGRNQQGSGLCQPPPMVVDPVVLQHFPFLWDYDMRGRPFVGADPGYHPYPPTPVGVFDFWLAKLID